MSSVFLVNLKSILKTQIVFAIIFNVSTCGCFLEERQHTHRRCFARDKTEVWVVSSAAGFVVRVGMGS